MFVRIDFAGPFHLRASSGRGRAHFKGYISVFVCLSTKAVHLEVVSGLDTRSFLNAFKRFISRRGMCSHIYSDCGKNFIGADSEIRELFNRNSAKSRTIVDDVSSQGIEWHFNPPAAPHFGGLWEAAVKSFKFHTKRVIGDQTLTFEEMSTLMSCIEACLNSRPLIPMSDDSEDLSVLTPAHFLIGRPLLSLPEQGHQYENPGTLQRWQLLNQLRESFWLRWRRDYLQSLQTRGKWNKEKANLVVGDLVLISSEQTAPTHWPLGRVTQTFPGSDNLVRTVQVRTSDSSFRRPIHKLILLPGESE